MSRTSRLCFTLPQRGAKRSPSFGGIAALLDGFFDMRGKLLVDLAAQPIAAKGIAIRDHNDISHLLAKPS